MRTIYMALIAAILSAGAYASQSSALYGAPDGDSTAARRQQAAPAKLQARQPAVGKQGSVTKTTQKTNWSKIKGLFE